MANCPLLKYIQKTNSYKATAIKTVWYKHR